MTLLCPEFRCVFAVPPTWSALTRTRCAHRPAPGHQHLRAQLLPSIEFDRPDFPWREAGLHFLRMLELSAATKKYRLAFLSKYALQPLPGDAAVSADDTTLRFVQNMVGRAPDARLLATAFRASGTAPIAFDPALKIAAADVAALQHTATAWLSWYDGAFAEPAAPADDAWIPARLEYAVSVSTRLSAQSQDGVTFSASEFDGGRLDWSSFDVNTTCNLDTPTERRSCARPAIRPAGVFIAALATNRHEVSMLTVAFTRIPRSI